MPGPQPTPTAVLAARGSWRANERADEPVIPIAADCEPPAGLSERAEEVWRALAPRLRNSGLLSEADVPTFTRFVRLYAAWETAMLQFEAKPDRASVLTLSKLDDMVRKLEQRFGLSPADRVGLKADKPEEEDAKSRFFKKAG